MSSTMRHNQISIFCYIKKKLKFLNPYSLDYSNVRN